MRIGVPREIKEDENRVGLLPAGVEAFCAAEGIDAEPGRHLVVARDDDQGRELADALAGLLLDPAQCDALARAARERVVSRYGWQPRADELHELLRAASGVALSSASVGPI